MCAVSLVSHVNVPSFHQRKEGVEGEAGEDVDGDV